MRGAGLPVETLVQYIKLFDKGDETAEERRQLLIGQREVLKTKIADMESALERLNYKIDVYYKDILEREKKMLGR